LTAWLSKDNHYPNQSINRNRIYALIKHIIPKKYNKKLSKGDIYHIYDTEEKKEYFIENIQQEDGL
jgi:hypothetical protein